MYIKINPFVTLIIGITLLPTSFIMREFPIHSTRLLSSVFAGVGVGLIGSFFLFSQVKRWTDRLDAWFENWNDKI